MTFCVETVSSQSGNRKWAICRTHSQSSDIPKWETVEETTQQRGQGGNEAKAKTKQQQQTNKQTNQFYSLYTLHQGISLDLCVIITMVSSTHFDACDCIQELHGHRKRVCTENRLTGDSNPRQYCCSFFQPDHSTN